MVTCLSRDRVSLFALGLILVFILGLMKPATAFPAVTISASPSTVLVAAGSSATTTITFHLTFTIGNPIMTCVGLPTGASCSFPPLLGIFNDGDHFTLTISASSSTAQGAYSVTIELTSYEDMIQPSFLAISPIHFNSASSAGIGPSSISIQQAAPSVTITILVAPPIPEYPIGLPLLAIFMVVTYSLIRRRRLD